MFSALKHIFRKKCLKKYTSDIKTGMIPLRFIHSAVILLNAGDSDFRTVENEAAKFFKGHDILLTFIFLDTKKYTKGEMPPTPQESTVFRKDLNWFGKPSKAKCSKLLENKTDLLICLSGQCDFSLQFISAAYPASFKIGGNTSDPGPYDIVVCAPAGNGSSISEMFSSVTSILKSIR